MRKSQRTLLLIAVLFLIAEFFLPLWRIEIWAPQYPEGLLMQIGLGSITGNINQINILNHYVGMKHIEPSSIPELHIMPWVLGALTVLGLIAVLLNRRWFAELWFAILCVAAIAGLYDFYQWGYDYGHHLNPNAPIKIPGMVYQPPLLGEKTLLNITAYSLPDWGGYCLVVAMALAAIAIVGPRIRKTTVVLLAMTSIANGTACTAKPSPIRAGVDSCETCRMLITDLRFGGEIVTKKGRTHKFDSLPCLIRYNKAHSQEDGRILVSDYFAPGTLIDLDQAHFIRSDQIRGPMGSGLIASRDVAKLNEIRLKTSGESLEWNAVVASVH